MQQHREVEHDRERERRRRTSRRRGPAATSSMRGRDDERDQQRRRANHEDGPGRRCPRSCRSRRCPAGAGRGRRPAGRCRHAADASRRPRRAGAGAQPPSLSVGSPRVRACDLEHASAGARRWARRPVDGVDVLGALSPSRAGDFMTCPLLYRFRTIDRLPEPPSPDAVRGTVVHKVLEDLFDLPAAERTPERGAATCSSPPGSRCSRREPGARRDVRRREGPELAAWLASCRDVLDRYFTLEDPRRLEPAERELYVETLLDSRLLLRGFVDRIDVAPDGAIRVVDYKTGRSPGRGLRGQGAVPDEVLRARPLAHPRRRPGGAPAGLPRQRRDPPLRARRGRPARHRAQGRGGLARRSAAPRRPGDWRPSPSRLCDWCSFHQFCPTKGGTIPPLPEPVVPTRDASVDETDD